MSVEKTTHTHITHRIYFPAPSIHPSINELQLQFQEPNAFIDLSLSTALQNFIKIYFKILN